MADSRWDDSPGPALRARGIDPHALIAFVSDKRGRSVVVGDEVKQALTLDLKRGSIEELQNAVVQASGAGSLDLGRAILVGGPERLSSARDNPLRASLRRGGYQGRRVTLTFIRMRLTNLFRMLSGVSKLPFEVAQGVEDRVTIVATNVNWDEVAELLALSSDMGPPRAGQTVRFSRRGDGAPRFAPIGPELVRDPPAHGSFRDVQGCDPALSEVGLGEIRLVAVVTGIPEPEALVRMPSGRLFRVRRDSCLGRAGVLVASVERDRIVVRHRASNGDQAGVEHLLLDPVPSAQRVSPP